MDPAGWGTEDSVEKRLFTEGYNFEFFQAVRLLMRVLPDRDPVGTAAKPPTEAVRFASRVSLEFPASSIHDIVLNEKGGPPLMIIAFLGLMGPNGVLPLHYTEWMVLRESAKDTAMAAFFNLFNHRWIAIFYRAWEKHCFPVAFERTQLEKRSQVRLNHYLFDLVGLGTKGLRKRMTLQDESFLLYAGLVAQRPRSASALRGILRDYFGIPVEIAQCLGGWYPLEADDHCYLREKGLYNQLGEGAIAGDAVWDQQSRFRVEFGPMDYDRFCEFLPGTRSVAEFEDLVRFLLGTTFVFDRQLILNGRSVPAARLTDSPPRLGWDSWLTETPLPQDAGDAVFASVT